MADRKDGWVEQVETTRAQSSIDRTLPQAAFAQLPPGDHPVLPLGQCRDLGV
jgi:hypothetical protein